jgi:hypothetical protein
MAANPRIVKTDTTFTYDGVSQTIQMSTIIDVPAGSALETAIGAGNLATLGTAGVPTAASVAMGGAYLCDIQDIGS